MKKFLEFLSTVLRAMCPLPEDITPEQAQALASAALHRDDYRW
jgi:hypothetical protein